MKLDGATLAPLLVALVAKVDGVNASKCHPRPSSGSSATPTTPYSIVTVSSSALGSASSSSASVTLSVTSSTASTTTPSSNSIASTPGTISSSSSSATTIFNPVGYTYYEVSLPVRFDGTVSSKLRATSTYTLEPSTPTDTTSQCIINASSAEVAQIEISDNAGHVFVQKSDGSIGVLANSDFPGSDAAPNQQYAGSLVFKPRATENGLFHLITTSGKKVAYQAVNSQVLALDESASTGDNLIPLFDFTCDGKLVVKDPNSAPLKWRVNSDGSSTEMITGEPSSPEQEVLFVVANKPALPRRATTDLMPDLTRRMSPYTDGLYPRLPSSPDDMFARPRAGARVMGGSNPSGICGSGSTSAASALFLTTDFHTCCILNDYCYDNCATGTEDICNIGTNGNEYCRPGVWEGCNENLYACMMDSVCAGISWSTQPAERQRCELEAGYIRDAMGTAAGGEVFNQATRERCGGYCPGGRPFCGGDVNGGECARADDGDNCEECGQSCNAAAGFACQASKCTCTKDTASDSQNCGGCGWICPKGTRCNGSGQCVCADQTCAGNLCVDTQSHPRNCGQCGNVCATGFCDGGECVDPSSLPSPTSPEGCLATNAVRNGEFESTTDGSVAASWSVTDVTGGASMTFVRRTTGASVAKYSLGTAGTVTLRQTLTLCPGKEYALTYSSTGSGKGSLITTLRDSGTGTERPLNWADFQSALDVSNDNNMSASGPFRFTAPVTADGQNTVTMELVFAGKARDSAFATQILLNDVTVFQP